MSLIFNIEGVEQRFKELTEAECSKSGIEILALECHIDHVHIFVSVLPTISVQHILLLKVNIITINPIELLIRETTSVL